MSNQNESPFGNPRFIVSIIAVFLFLWGWQYYMNKTYPPVIPKAPSVSAATGSQPGQPAEALLPAGAQPAQIKAAPTDEKTFKYEDAQVKWEISSVGMGLNSLELKSYFNKEKAPMVFAGRIFPLAADNQPVYFELNKVSETQFVGNAVVNGKNLRRTLTYNPSSMSFESETEFETAPATLSFSTTDSKHEHSANFLMPTFEKQDFLYKDSEKVKTEHISAVKDSEVVNKTAANVQLASIGSQYFTQSLIDKSDILPSINMSVVGKTATLNVIYDLKGAKISKIKDILYVGAKSSDILPVVDPLMPEVMDYGIFGFISKPLLTLMKFLHGIFGNWGVAIIALTIIMRLLMLPFNIVSFKSARAMQKIQPQLQAVREKYKNDPMAVNRETMALMKEHNANPLSSCLPMLIQIPIFFALWRTISSSIDIYQQPFFGWITDLSAHDKYYVLPVLMGVTMFFQQKMTPTTMDPTQAKILNFMPILFAVFMLSLPSGLTLYNFVSTLFVVIQQYFLLKDNNKKSNLT